ncbi:hypothetical protein [Streptomyces sp. H34-S4]|uniref:hypothetical protein n=1 Tax=Streptomyces sp. H34-S4 TaxID=2996463 RepID=UPI0022703593|nr:hypothetical protein [Streptomyces sp. H34-S4]MCY0933666.1 hypothetical protein [Streptomyces sp. H34-S4]
MSNVETLKELVAQYENAFKEREAELATHLDDDGEMKEGADEEEYHEASHDAWLDSHNDLYTLLGVLKSLCI